MVSLRSGLCPLLGLRSDFSRNSKLEPELEKKFVKLQSSRGGVVGLGLGGKGLRVCCRVKEDGDKESNGEEPPESLFMKELRRRGMTPTSLLEESKTSKYQQDEEVKMNEDDRGFSKRNVFSTEYERSLSNQRERSMALNSEGLEGLVPRAKLLLTLGGTFFLAFWPLILSTFGFFAALYFYLGPSFIHNASETPMSPPPYIDPYALLEDERLSQTPFVK